MTRKELKSKSKSELIQMVIDVIILPVCRDLRRQDLIEVLAERVCPKEIAKSAWKFGDKILS